MEQTNSCTLQEFAFLGSQNFLEDELTLSRLLLDISDAVKCINTELFKNACSNRRPLTNRINLHGEQVHYLDIAANNILLKTLKKGHHCAGVASEEMDDILIFDHPESNESNFIVMLDPLDGSSNIDVNISIGTIFGIYRRQTVKGHPCRIDDFLQNGYQQVAAGYAIYGPTTLFVYTCNDAVNGFTYNADTYEFHLSHANIKCPSRGSVYSFNHSYLDIYDKQVKKYINLCLLKSNQNNQNYTHRYVGSMVADIHRILIKGGIFFYPRTNVNRSGKLRLMYECNPFAFIICAAGGNATDGKKDILYIQPKDIHMKTGFIIGSSVMMEDLANIGKQIIY